MSDQVKNAPSDKIANRNNWLKIFVVVVVTTLVAFKLWQADFTKVLSGFDFTDLLALFLAMFAIVLSVLFYFKATDTSNVFYDNTYRFTKDMSEILGRIEAGFGEKLKHLDEGYSGLKTAVEKIPFDREKAEKDIKQEERQLEKVLNERDAIIEDLASKAKLEKTEKEHYFHNLNIKDKELENVKVELNRLRRKIQKGSHKQLGMTMDSVLDQATRYVIFELMRNHIGKVDLDSISIHVVIDKFKKVLKDLEPVISEDLVQANMVNEELALTIKGYDMLKDIFDEQGY